MLTVTGEGVLPTSGFSSLGAFFSSFSSMGVTTRCIIAFGRKYGTPYPFRKVIDGASFGAVVVWRSTSRLSPPLIVVYVEHVDKRAKQPVPTRSLCQRDRFNSGRGSDLGTGVRDEMQGGISVLLRGR